MELLDRARGGDREAAAALALRLRSMIAAYLHRRLDTSSGLIDDVISETLLRVVEGVSGCRASREDSLLAWVLRIAQRCSVDAIRAEYPAQLVALCWDVPDFGVDQPGAGIAEKVTRLLREAHDALDDAPQRLLWHRLVLNQTWDELGASLGTTGPAMKRRYQRVIARLRRDILERARALPESDRAAVQDYLGRLDPSISD